MDLFQFRTRRFTVRAVTYPCRDDPRDSFQFDEDVEAVTTGRVDWFDVEVTVEFAGRVIGSDYLGGCAYVSAEDFVTGHRDPDPLNRNSSVMRSAKGENACICPYFPGMVAEAIADARGFLEKAAA